MNNAPLPYKRGSRHIDSSIYLVLALSKGAYKEQARNVQIHNNPQQGE